MMMHHVEFGVNNVFNKQPPFPYANNTLNANTDPSDFDFIGRYFFGRAMVSVLTVDTPTALAAIRRPGRAVDRSGQ